MRKSLLGRSDDFHFILVPISIKFSDEMHQRVIEYFLDAIASLEVAYVRVSVRCHQFCNHLSKTDKF